MNTPASPSYSPTVAIPFFFGKFVYIIFILSCIVLFVLRFILIKIYYLITVFLSNF